MAREKGMGTKKALLLGGSVIALTIAAIAASGRKTDAGNADDPIVVDEEVLEVQPLVPQGAIRSASWHDDAAEAKPHADAPAPGGESTSLLEGLGKDPERDARADKNLEEVVRRVNGLGVYVAPEEPVKKKERRAPGSKK